MDLILRNGWKLAEKTQIEYVGEGVCHVLESPGSKKTRKVVIGPVSSCDCDGFWKSGECSHFWAVCISLAKSHGIPIPRFQKKRQIPVQRNTRDMNRSYVDREDMFCRLVHAVTRHLPEPPRKRGKPAVSMRDMVQLLAYKAHTHKTTRGVSGTTLLTPYLGKELDHRTISKHAGMKPTEEALTQSIVLVAKEFQKTDRFFAADASSVPMLHTDEFGTSQEVILHVICGVKSKMVVAAAVRPEKSRESKSFVELLERAVELGFNVEAVAADKAYLTKDVQAALRKVKAVAYIPTKSTSRKGPDSLWDEEVQMALNSPKLFQLNYSSRNIVEGVFGNIETTMGKRVRVKNAQTLRTEVLSMVLAHNIVTLSNAIYRDDFRPSFPRVDSKHKPPRVKPKYGPVKLVDGEYVSVPFPEWP